MLAQLRTYTINTGMMDQWLQLFGTEIAPRTMSAGMDIPVTAVNHENTKFIWIRTFENETDLKIKEAAFSNSEWWKNNIDYVRSHFAHRTIELIHLQPSQSN